MPKPLDPGAEPNTASARVYVRPQIVFRGSLCTVNGVSPGIGDSLDPFTRKGGGFLSPPGSPPPPPR
jgi:hypothetical protein